MVLPHRSRRESNLRKTPLSDNVWQGRFYIVFKGNVYFDEREQNRLVFKGRLRWIFQMLIVGNHYLLADAEFREYLDENIVVGDFACDGAQVVDDLADVFA